MTRSSGINAGAEGAAKARRLILASGSAGRRGLLEAAGYDFVAIPSECGEDAEGEPKRIVMELARRKARDVSARVGEGLVIGADTLVSLDGKVFGKPESEERAREMLRELSGKTHQVYTGLCVIDAADGAERAALGESDVTFKAMTEEEIDAYLAKGDYAGRAGAYAIQGSFREYVRSHTGEESNIIGLPMGILSRMLTEAR